MVLSAERLILWSSEERVSGLEIHNSKNGLVLLVGFTLTIVPQMASFCLWGFTLTIVPHRESEFSASSRYFS